jgi:hypothetical protein
MRSHPGVIPYFAGSLFGTVSFAKEKSMSVSQGTPLHRIPGWTKSLADKLAGSWITTAEQVVASTATPAGLKAMASHLGVSEERMRDLVASARGELHPDVARSLEQPVDMSQFGFGALKPHDV